jgi:hypothetical protein
MLMKIKKYQNGQVLLFVVLLITVIVTVTLSMMSRSIINLRLSAEEYQSQKALSAAEAGIEQSIIASKAITNGSLSDNTNFSTKYTALSGSSFLLSNGNVIIKDEGADIWLSDYSADDNKIYKNPWSGTLNIYWGTNSPTCPPAASSNIASALEVIIISGTRNNPQAQHYVFDSCAGRRANNNFSIPGGGGTIDAKTFSYSASIPVASPGLLARVIPLYANAYIAVSGSVALPAQGVVIESTGSVGNVKRSVSALQQYPILPSEFFAYTFLWPK